MADRAIARRYATAFIDLAQEANAIDAFAADLGTALEACRANDGELNAVLANPVFTTEERRRVLDAIIPRLGLKHQLTANLLRLLLDNGRFALLADVVATYAEFADERQGRVRVAVQTAEPMSPQLEAEIRAAFQRMTGKSVLLDATVEPALIGGLTARIGSKLYDASVRARLDAVRKRLLDAQPPAEA